MENLPKINKFMHKLVSRSLLLFCFVFFCFKFIIALLSNTHIVIAAGHIYLSVLYLSSKNGQLTKATVKLLLVINYITDYIYFNFKTTFA